MSDAGPLRRPLAAAICLALAVALLGCGSGGERFRPAQVGPGEAVIYVYRPRSVVSPGPVRVFVDQREAGRLARNQYLAAIVAPGEHLVRVQRRSEIVRLVRVGEGESAYLEAGADLLGGAVTLASLAEGPARERIAQARAAPAEPEGPPEGADAAAWAR